MFAGVLYHHRLRLVAQIILSYTQLKWRIVLPRIYGIILITLSSKSYSIHHPFAGHKCLPQRMMLLASNTMRYSPSPSYLAPLSLSKSPTALITPLLPMQSAYPPATAAKSTQPSPSRKTMAHCHPTMSSS